MNIYEMGIGNIKFFVVAEDEADAKKQAADPAKYPGSHYLPVKPTLVSVPGYEITAYPEVEAPDELTEREELKAILVGRGVEFNPRLGDAKLRELVEQTAPKEEEVTE